MATGVEDRLEQTGFARARNGSGVTPRLYQRAFEILHGEISRRELAPGTRLIETGVAARFGISRAPARHALARLAGTGLIEKAAGRGYVVRDWDETGSGKASEDGQPPATVLASLPSWQRIHGEVEREIVARTSFASWRVVESELARHYQVSRTVAREVLGRLQQRGVVEKDERGRWRAPGLTPRRIGELYELRAALEPLALVKAADRIPTRELAAMQRHLSSAIEQPNLISGPTLDQLEEELHIDLLAYCSNATLMQAIALPQSLLIAHRLLYQWAPRLYELEPFLPEHLDVVVRLQAGQLSESSDALRNHLLISGDRMSQRVSGFAIEFHPSPLGYLERIEA